MAPFRVLPLLSPLLLQRGEARLGEPAGHPAIELDMFRAIGGADINSELANVDLGDIGGVLSYIHTEVIGENVQCNTNFAHTPPEERRTRCHSVDEILRARVRVKNPEALVNEVGSLYSWVDFGPAMNFQGGQARAGLDTVKKYGDFVGAQERTDRRFPSRDPLYWFSLGGFCPSLPWGSKGAVDRPDPRCPSSAGGEALLGGRCPVGLTAPIGAPGCAYTYEQPGPASAVRLDELVGITSEDCGGRPCRDFVDWRQSCTNTAYKRRFNYSRRRRNLKRSPVCVEYDIAPACARGCDTAACKRLPAAERELGLPFWRGRCDADSNGRRAERLAQSFGLSDANTSHQLVAPEVREAFQTCRVGGQSRLCHPSPETGSNYCTRLWGGVCQPCLIPGTAKQDGNAQAHPLCPWSILSSSDYARSPPPACESTRPRDLCCIYTSGCDARISSDPAETPLDDDGYALVLAKRSTPALLTLIRRIIAEKWNTTASDPQALESAAYWGWNHAPTRHASIADLEARIAAFVSAPPTMTTTPLPDSSSATPTTSQASRAGTPREEPRGEPTKSGALRQGAWLAWLLLPLVRACRA